LLNDSPRWPHAGLLIWLPIVTAAILCAACGPKAQVNKPVASTSPPPAVVTATPVQYPSAVVGQPYPGTGVVTLINFKEGWIEIRHEEIKGLMPAMEMEWWVTDRSLLKSVQVGDSVDFTVVETGKGEFITRLKRKPADP
jgi:Cu/Ag efflux protein CusF